MLSKLKEDNSFGMIGTSIMKTHIENNDTIVTPEKKFSAYRYALFAAAIAICIAALISLGYGNSYYGLLQKLQLVLFFVGGIFSARYLGNKLASEKNVLIGKASKTALIGALVMVIGIALVYWISDTIQWSLAAGSAAMYLLPQLLMEQWQQSISVAGGKAPMWQLPANEVDKRVGISLNSFRITLKVTSDYFSQEEIAIPSTEPGRTVLGKIFQRAISQYASVGDQDITVVDEEMRPYYWSFSVSGLLGKRYLNPELTLLENKVANNAEIVVQRIKNNSTN